MVFDVRDRFEENFRLEENRSRARSYRNRLKINETDQRNGRGQERSKKKNWDRADDERIVRGIRRLDCYYHGGGCLSLSSRSFLDRVAVSLRTSIPTLLEYRQQPRSRVASMVTSTASLLVLFIRVYRESQIANRSEIHRSPFLPLQR